MLKRSFDAVMGCTLLVLASPLLLLVAVAVRLDSPGPVIFRQRRVGLGQRPFELLKFRSMVADASRKGPHFTQDGDPRVTRVGRFIRRTSLDELPQLVNVVRGDMSLVGPRPDVPEQIADYSPQEWAQRHAVRPGITGLAQATARSAATPEQRKMLDLRYVEQACFAGDLWLLVLTVRQLFRGRTN